MKEYTTIRRVSHDNRDYAIGEPIELDDDHAQALLAVGAIAEKEPAEGEAKPKGKKK
ncbi:MAG: hypothetical protein IPP91_11285 [Betaproteobacteria bacterium]|nr:hypothetical protein [Betaproteobacteria bacterium]